jgi:hypothetical protein
MVRIAVGLAHSGWSRCLHNEWLDAMRCSRVPSRTYTTFDVLELLDIEERGV